MREVPPGSFPPGTWSYGDLMEPVRDTVYPVMVA